ncbi:hypothetical protein EJB05_11318, partial [Eragrostis curvula]
MAQDAVPLSEANTYKRLREQENEPERDTEREMAQDTISHFSHPGHELVKRHHLGPTCLCDMCCEHLTGPAYGCDAGCDFAIHESCAGHSLTLSSPELHAHELALVQTHKELVCDVCAGRCAPRCFLYRCQPCDFDMHPYCARLPQTAVRSAQHPGHDLTLVLAQGSCAVCRHGVPAGGPPGWFYRCSACNVDLHVSCACGAREQGSNAGARRNNGARHDERSRVLAADHLRSRLQLQALQNAIDYVSPPDAEEQRRRN